MIHELVLPILLAFKSGVSASIDGIEDSDIPWVTAGVLSDHDTPGYRLWLKIRLH